MQLSLAAAVTLFLTTTTFVYAQNADNSLAAPQHPRDFQVESRDGLDLSNIDIEDADISERDFLDSRKTENCSNVEKIKRVKPEYKGKCNPKDSKGFRSAHNCKNSSGKSYLCVQKNKATCYSISDAAKRSFENGECFN